MEIRHLRHFVALAEERSFTRAATRELIVQSGLSSSVRALEKDIGARLFVRGTRPVRLTAEGQVLLPAARHALDAIDAAYQAVHDLRGVLTGHLRLGAYPVNPNVLPFARWLADFARAHPGIDIEVRQASGLRMTRMVADGELDCAVLDALPGRTGGLEVLSLFAEPLALACPTGHPLATADGVELARVAGEPFVETDSTWTTRIRIDEAFAAAGLTRRITCEVSDWGLVLDLVSAGLGLAMVPNSCRLTPAAGPSGSVRLVPLADGGLERHLDLVLPPREAASPAARRFADHLYRESTSWLAEGSPGS